MQGKLLSKSTRARLILDDKETRAVPPAEAAERMRKHQESKHHVGPDPHTTRLQIRSKIGQEAEAKLVRGMYDRAEKPRKRRRKKS
jgi:hypothetical protein